MLGGRTRTRLRVATQSPEPQLRPKVSLVARGNQQQQPDSAVAHKERLHRNRCRVGSRNPLMQGLLHGTEDTVDGVAVGAIWEAHGNTVFSTPSGRRKRWLKLE